MVKRFLPSWLTTRNKITSEKILSSQYHKDLIRMQDLLDDIVRTPADKNNLLAQAQQIIKDYDKHGYSKEYTTLYKVYSQWLDNYEQGALPQDSALNPEYQVLLQQALSTQPDISSSSYSIQGGLPDRFYYANEQESKNQAPPSFQPPSYISPQTPQDPERNNNRNRVPKNSRYIAPAAKSDLEIKVIEEVVKSYLKANKPEMLIKAKQTIQQLVHKAIEANSIVAPVIAAQLEPFMEQLEAFRYSIFSRTEDIRKYLSTSSNSASTGGNQITEIYKNRDGQASAFADKFAEILYPRQEYLANMQLTHENIAKITPADIHSSITTKPEHLCRAMEATKHLPSAYKENGPFYSVVRNINLNYVGKARGGAYEIETAYELQQKGIPIEEFSRVYKIKDTCTLDYTPMVLDEEKINIEYDIVTRCGKLIECKDVNWSFHDLSNITDNIRKLIENFPIQRDVAAKIGKDFIVYSKQPITNAWKNWFTQNNIKFLEFTP